MPGRTTAPTVLVDFWRVEHAETGKGPFAGDRAWLDRVPRAEWDHWPAATFRYNAERDHFGFVSLTQYKRWFAPAERRALRDAGFVLRRYRVPARLVKQDAAQATVPLRRPDVATLPAATRDPRRPETTGAGRWVTIKGVHVLLKG